MTLWCNPLLSAAIKKRFGKQPREREAYDGSTAPCLLLAEPLGLIGCGNYRCLPELSTMHVKHVRSFSTMTIASQP